MLTDNVAEEVQAPLPLTFYSFFFLQNRFKISQVISHKNLSTSLIDITEREEEKSKPTYVSQNSDSETEMCKCIWPCQVKSGQAMSSWLKQKINKLAKARKMRKPAGTLGLKKFGPGKLWV